MVIPINAKAELTYEKYRALQKQLLNTKLLNGARKRATRLTRPSECVICSLPIRPGEMFYDAGYRNRAHQACLTASLFT
jgi:hypothetical protein